MKKQNIMLRILSLVLTITLVFALAGCRSQKDSSSVSSDISDLSSTIITDIVDIESGTESDVEDVTSNVTTDSSGSTQNNNSSGNTSATTSSSESTPSTGNAIFGSGEKTSYTKEEIIAKMPKELKGTTIRYAYWWDPYTQMDKQAIESFTKATGIKVEAVVLSYSDFQTQLASLIAAGNAPDVVRLLSNATYQVANVQPITNTNYPYFNDTAWDERLMRDYTFNGKTYAANLRDSAIMDVGVMFYNKNALKKAGLEDPYTIWKNDPSKWTWNKFWSMCQDFVDAMPNSDKYVGSMWTYANAAIRSQGATYYDYDSEKGQWVNNMKSDVLLKAWQDMHKKYDSRLSMYGANGTAFERGYILFCQRGCHGLRVNDYNFQTMKEKGTLGYVPMPTDGNQLLEEYTAFAIPKGAKNAEAVPYYLRWVLDKSSYGANMDGVYISDEARDVVNYAQSRYDDYFFGENSNYQVEEALLGGGAEQVKSALDRMYGTIQDIVDGCNDAIKKLSD